MRPALPLLALLLAACPERRTAPEPAPPAARSPAEPPRPSAPAWTSVEETCVDRWLAAHHLDAYGNPEGTMYTGGTPLLDEASGRAMSRQAYLSAHRPEPLRACLHGD